MRNRVVSVRFSASEYERLRSLRDRSPVIDDRGRERRSMALWCRAMVNRSLLLDDLRPGLPVVAPEAITIVSDACNNLNALTRLANIDLEVSSEAVDALESVCSELSRSLPVLDDDEATSVERGPVDRLLNIRLSTDDLLMWQESAAQVGFSRVSAWVCDVLLGLAGYVRVRRADHSVVEVRRQIAGAINNAAQLQAVAEISSSDQFGAVEVWGVKLIDLMAAWNVLGRVR